jgi:hypothetical protein
MNKDYQKPEVELISMTAEETVTTEGTPDVGLGTGSSIF